MEDDVHKQSLIEVLFLHIMPGLLITVFTYGLTYLFRSQHVPSFLFFEVASVVILLPWVVITLKHYTKLEKRKSIKELIVYKNHLKCYQYIIYCLVMLLVGLIVLIIFNKSIHSVIKASLFDWFPNWLDMSDVYLNSNTYSKNMVLLVWFLGIITSGVIAPILEEVYFRGFLLPRINGNTFFVVVISSVLFAFYNCWTLWMVPGRIIVTLLLVYFVVRKKNITLAISAHCLLNIVGDSLLSIPIVFH